MDDEICSFWHNKKYSRPNNKNTVLEICPAVDASWNDRMDTVAVASSVHMEYNGMVPSCHMACRSVVDRKLVVANACLTITTNDVMNY